MAMPKPYQLADQAQAQLNKAALRRSEQTKQRLIIDGFDELNVLKQTDVLYADLDKQNRKKYKELFIVRYIEMMLWLLARELTKEEEDSVDQLAEMHITGLLDEPNETTHYTYATEVLRKRDRAKEAILSVPTKAQKQLELDKHLRYFQQMGMWYMDAVSDDATMQALKDADVKYVVWNTSGDDKVCKLCRDKDGNIYAIEKVPSKPHLNCRCYVTPKNS